jgi:hypothetical protein
MVVAASRNKEHRGSIHEVLILYLVSCLLVVLEATLSRPEPVLQSFSVSIILLARSVAGLTPYMSARSPASLSLFANINSTLPLLPLAVEDPSSYALHTVGLLQSTT